MNENVKVLLEAERLKGLQDVTLDPAMDVLLAGNVAKKIEEETIDYVFYPSVLFSTMAEEIVLNVKRVFRGVNLCFEPKLTGDDEDDVELITRYLESFMTLKMSNIRPEMKKHDKINNLRNEVRSSLPVVPYLAANAMACMGTVTWHNKSLLIKPLYAKEYDWRERTIDLKEYAQVRAWFQTLLLWGFQCVEDFNATPEGDLEFMLMVFLEENLEVEGLLPADQQQKIRLRSDKPVSNIKALFRSFFINKRVKYITDERLVHSYNSIDYMELLAQHVIKKMIIDDAVPTYMKNRTSDQYVPKAEGNTEVKPNSADAIATV